MYVILRLLRRRGFTISGIQEHPAALEPLGEATVPFESTLHNQVHPATEERLQVLLESEVPLKSIRRSRRSSFLFSLQPDVDPRCFRIAFTERVGATRRTRVESS